MMNEEELLRKYKNEDREAFNVLVQRYASSVYAFLHRYLKSSDDAEDITQEAFLRAWINARKFNKLKSFKSWLFSIAKNAALDLLKKKKEIPFSNFTDESGDNVLEASLVDEEPLPDELFERANTGEILNNALQRLSPEQREILSLHYDGDLTFKEIGEVVNESMNTVKTKHFRALSVLRKRLQELAPDVFRKSKNIIE